MRVDRVRATERLAERPPDRQRCLRLMVELQDAAGHDDLSGLLRLLANRDRVRSEATVQADVRQLLLHCDLGLAEHDIDVSLEAQVGDRRRIDVELGFTVIEVKKDLRNPAVVEQAVQQLAGYVTARTNRPANATSES